MLISLFMQIKLGRAAACWLIRCAGLVFGLAVASVVVFASPFIIASDKSNAEPTIAVSRVSLVSFVSTRISVTAGSRQLVAPLCEFGETGTYDLCFLAASLEVDTPEGWRPAPVDGSLGRVCGGVPLSQARLITIPPGTTAEFSYRFEKTCWVILPGGRVRVVAHFWPNEAALKAAQTSIDVASEPFQCP